MISAGPTTLNHFIKLTIKYRDVTYVFDQRIMNMEKTYENLIKKTYEKVDGNF